MNYYALFLRNESIDFASYSPEEMQRIMGDFDAWNARMVAGGQLLASASLQGGGGKTLRAGVVSDGPYSEAKEAVAGLLIIEAPDFEQALAIAEECPFLSRGGSVEVRPIGELEFEDAAQAVVAMHSRARAAHEGRLA